MTKELKVKSVRCKVKTQSLKLLIFGFTLLVLHFTFTCYAQDTDKEDEMFFVAQKAFNDGFYDVSLGLFERFLKDYPGSSQSSQTNLLIGQCYFHQNKFLDALAKFESLLNQSNFADIQDAVIYWIAEVHFRGNDFNKAAVYYKKITDDFPVSIYTAAANYSLGWCLFQDARFEDALKYFKIVEEKYPKESFAKESSFKIIETLYNLKDYTSLKDKLKSYLKIYSQDSAKIPYLYFYLGEADYYLNNYAEAIEEYSRGLAAAADDKIQALAKLGMGWAYLKLKKYRESEDAFSGVDADSLEKTSVEVLLLGKAILMSETKRFTEAMTAYTRVLKTGSDTILLIQAYCGLAEVLYNTGEYKQAVNLYKEALGKRYSGIPQEFIDKLHYGLAWAYLKEGQFKEAIEEFQKVVKLSADKIVKVSALCQIGDAYQDSADFDQALQTYDSILKDYPDSLYTDYVQYQSGMTLLKSSNYEGAALSFQSFKKNFPGSKLLDDASYALGLAYFQKEDYNSSREVFDRFQNDFKDSYLRPQAMYLLATSFYNLGKFNEAIEIFKNIIREYNQDVELVQKAEYEIADCFYRLGQEKEAVLRFNSLRSKYPDANLASEVIWWLGEYYYRRGDLNLARRYFSSLIQDFPKSSLIPNAYYALGSIYKEEDKYEEAINNFQKVVEAGKAELSGTASVAIADIYVRQDKDDLALKAYKDILTKYTNLASLVYPKIADIYVKIKDYEQAVAFYRKSQELVPVNEMSNIQFKIAEVRQAQGRPDQAIEEYLKVAYLYSENKELVMKSFLRVAAMYEDRENFKEAVNIYKKAAALDAEESKYAKERIEWIKENVK